ncbi:MAG: HEAT repeat domain-containing protein [Planctomycetota bacterium]
MRGRTAVRCTLVCLLAMLWMVLHTGRAGAEDARRVALMIEQTYNDHWGPVGTEAALILGCERILREHVNEVASIGIVDWRYTTGIQIAMRQGLYFPVGESAYAQWNALLDADVYIEAKLSEKEMVWEAHTPRGTERRTVARPFAHPKETAAELVRLVFAAAGVPIDPEREARLADPETTAPALFLEWAKWIGYHPHWAHHAPWAAPKTSADKIIRTDPAFARGMAWALHIQRRKGINQKQAPTGIQFFEQAFHVLDSRRHEAVHGMLRGWVTEDPKKLADALKSFERPELALAVGLGEETSSAAAGILSEENRRAETEAKDNRPKGPRVRRHLALALAGVKSERLVEAYRLVAAEDEDASVRAAAVEAMGACPPAATGEAIRTAFADDDAPEVRAAALAALARQKACTPRIVAAAAADASPVVRGRLVAVLPAEDADARRAVLLRLAADPDGGVRTAAFRALRADEGIAATDASVAGPLGRALADGDAAERRAAIAWIRDDGAAAFADHLAPLLAPDADPAVRAAAGRTLAALAPERTPEVIAAFRDSDSATVQMALADLLAGSDDPAHRELLFALLARASAQVREGVCDAAYRAIGSDRAALARIMRFDPSMRVNFAALRLARRIGDPDLVRDVVVWSAAEHPNEYARARALGLLEDLDRPELRPLCRAGLVSPFWIVRLEAADILSRQAVAEDTKAIRDAAADKSAEDPWIAMALEDALAHAEGRPAPERIRLGLGEREHTEGGHRPNGFQVWLGRMPKDREQARKMVEEGFRFGAKTDFWDIPGGASLGNWDNDKGWRNTYVLGGILDYIRRYEKSNALRYMYYIALFDEPVNFRGGELRDRMRTFALEAGRTDLLPMIASTPHNELEAELPNELQRSFAYFNARRSGEISNWIVHVYHLTARRKYPDLRIFPQTLSYMRKHSQDAFDLINADGDYSWIYHYGNFFQDGSIGAVNRILNPGKPLCMITWMSWHRPNILNGNTLYADTDFPMHPWRFRNYMGTCSGLALWATGTEAGFFDPIGLGKASDKDAQGKQALALTLEPYSPTADRAVKALMDDPRYWEVVEGKLAREQLEAAPDHEPVLDAMDEGGGDDLTSDMALRELEDAKSPMEEALAAERKRLYTHLMTGIGYMNQFNTDATRALSNLPKPDTRLRDTLIIFGRDTAFYADWGYMHMPAIALTGNYDMVPTYDCIGKADLMQYDTILLKDSRDGVTPELVEAINRWLQTKEGGLLVVSGHLDSDHLLFPMLRLQETAPAFLWESGLQVARTRRVEETYTHRRKQRTRVVPPHLKAFRVGGAERADTETRLDCTYAGAVDPLITTTDGQAILARWQAPAGVKSVVLFDGASWAGPVYTEALESAVRAIDRERGSDIVRNRWWGHIVYENDAFVIDVASSQFPTLHEARPRQHRGVDSITGVINPEVRHRQCAVILKDYVGPYAGGKGDWAVMARHELKAMTLEAPDRLRVHAIAPTRVSHIGPEIIRLRTTDGYEETDTPIALWKLMREGKRGYCFVEIEGGRELYYVDPDPVVVIAE